MFIRVEVVKEGKVVASDRFDLLGFINPHLLMTTLKGCLVRCGFVRQA